MKTACSLAAVVVFAATTHLAMAEVPRRSPQELRDDAAHIIVGKVQQVYTARRKEKDWEYADSVAEIAVESTEKGTGIAPGELVYVRYWNVKWIGSTQPPPHSSGHQGVAPGDNIRAFVTVNKKDKGRDAILPNGLNPLTSK